MAYYIVLSLGLVVSLVFCIKRRKGYSVGNLMFKSVSSLCYLLTATFALVSNSSAYIYGSLIIFGGALGLVGDILLDLKGIYRRDESKYLRGGFLFFLVGHVFYSSAIIYSIRMKWWVVLISIVIAILISFANLASQKITKVHFGAYRTIVTIYVAFLSLTMVLAIVAVLLSHFSKNYVILAIGAISFTLSDAILSSTFFGRGKDGSFYLFTNHFFYYAGQYLIAASVMFM
jgi:uncharacterized membrane protein YhhN